MHNLYVNFLPPRGSRRHEDRCKNGARIERTELLTMQAMPKNLTRVWRCQHAARIWQEVTVTARWLKKATIVLWQRFLAFIWCSSSATWEHHLAQWLRQIILSKATNLPVRRCRCWIADRFCHFQTNTKRAKVLQVITECQLFSTHHQGLQDKSAIEVNLTKAAMSNRDCLLSQNYVTILTRAARWMTYFDLNKLNFAVLSATHVVS